jgi:hypothetical protein
MNPTPYPALNGLLLELVSNAKAILGDKIAGAYLQGSLAIGDFDEHSDIDFLVVIEDQITESELSALQSLHARIHGLSGKYRPDCPVRKGTLAPNHWETSLEGSYFPRDLLNRLDAPGEKQWYLDNGSNILERSDHDNTLVVRWTLREHGITLFGPEPKSLITPIPVHALRCEVVATMHKIEAVISDPYYCSAFGQPFAVLTFCRMLQTLDTGKIHSKLSGVLWGQEKLNRRWSGLIQRAWDTRGQVHVSQPADPAAYQSTLEFIQYAIEESKHYFIDSSHD